MNSNPVKEIFGGQLRVRAMGVLVVDHTVLLVNHNGLNEQGEFWAPPGGGVHFGEHIHDAIVREYKEEVNLEVQVGEFLCGNEFIQEPFHAIELFFKISEYSGELRLGEDPELRNNHMLTDVRFVPFKELLAMENGTYHPILSNLNGGPEIVNKSGAFYLSE